MRRKKGSPRPPKLAQGRRHLPPGALPAPPKSEVVQTKKGPDTRAETRRQKERLATAGPRRKRSADGAAGSRRWPVPLLPKAATGDSRYLFTLIHQQQRSGQRMLKTERRTTVPPPKSLSPMLVGGTNSAATDLCVLAAQTDRAMPASFARKLSHFIQLSELEQQILRSMPAHQRQVEAGRDIVS